jgi:outer membrane protein OmpU
MNNLKKIGLTALAASLVTTSAFAGALTVSGGASVSLKNMTGTKDTSTGKSFSMGNQITFAGSGELDNGLNVALSFTIDESDGNTATTDGAANGSIFDGHSVTISSDALGSLKFSGEGGSSAQGAMDAGAAGDIWNTGTGIAEIAGAAAGDNSLFYTLPEMMDGVALTASVSPGRHAQNTHTSYGVVYTGVEGLTLKFGQGDSGAPATETKSTTMHASYAIGSFTLGVANTEADNTGAVNREVDSMQIAYTLTDDMSLTYGEETFDTAGNATDEEVSKLGVSYTTGGMTIGAATIESKGAGNTVGSKSERWQLDLSFAF